MTNSHLANTIDCVMDAQTSLDKAMLLLGDITTLYSFTEKPECCLETANEEGQTWMWNYPRIITMVEMVFDYVCAASMSVDKATDNATKKKAELE